MQYVQAGRCLLSFFLFLRRRYVMLYPIARSERSIMHVENCTVMIHEINGR